MNELVKLLNVYLKEVGARIKSDLRLDKNDLCIFKKENCSLDFVVELSKDSGFCFFYTPICKVPFDYPEKLFERLLSNNLFGLANNQAIFGLDNKTQHIILSFAFKLNSLDSISFGNTLINFTRTAENARKRIDKWQSDLAAELGKSASDGMNISDQSLTLKA